MDWSSGGFWLNGKISLTSYGLGDVCGGASALIIDDDSLLFSQCVVFPDKPQPFEIAIDEIQVYVVGHAVFEDLWFGTRSSAFLLSGIQQLATQRGSV
jgi:hypothetical protein